MRDCKGSRRKIGQPLREKKPIPKDGNEKRPEMHPGLKSFLDNCIVPILVKSYLERRAGSKQES
jgi:hypothetical protein